MALFASVVATAGGLLVGCKQGAGERCQTQSDCGDGLLCILPPGGTPQTGGVCTVPGSLTDGGTSADFAVASDLSATSSDGGAADQGASADLVTSAGDLGDVDAL